MSNAEKLKKIRTAAALAAIAGGGMPPIVREALVGASELLADFEVRIQRLESVDQPGGR